MVLAVAASVLLAVPASAGAQSGGLEVELPPNTDCRGAAVIAKTTVVEDAAAANMLAEALRALSRGGTQRCLLDAGLPPGRGRPQHEAVPPDAVYRSSAGVAETVYVVGGPAAIPDSWLSEQLGVTGFIRVAGADRWQTQQSVAAAMLALAAGSSVQPYDPASVAAATRALPPNGDCYGTAVLAKLTIAEERAAANMLAAALTAISGDPDSRCLVDVGDPGADRPPSAVAVAEAAQASGAYLLGGEVAVPQRWIDKGFDIRFLERIFGLDRWATQSAVAETIVDIAQDGILPHQYVSPTGVVSVYDDYRYRESQKLESEVPDAAAHLQAANRHHEITVYYCGSESALGSEAARAAARQYIASEVDDLNRYVAAFWGRETGGSATFRFVAAPTLLAADDPLNWDDGFDSDAANDADEACESELSGSDGYVLIDQAFGADSNSGGWAYLSDQFAIQPTRRHYPNASQFYNTVAHEVGHGWLGLCHPHGQDTGGCHPDHDSVVYERFSQSAQGSNDANRLCGIMSYCDERNGYVSDYARIDWTTDQSGKSWIFVGCGQRQLLNWLPGPDTPYGSCVAGPAGSDDEPPDAPSLSVTPRGGQLSVSWSAPSDNGAAITGYEVRWRQGSGSWDSRSVGGTSYMIGSLRNGSQYEVQVRARNSVGPGDWSLPAYGTPVGPPGAPRGLSLTPGVGEIGVSWGASQENGSPVTGYTVSWSGGQSGQRRLGGSQLSYMISGLAGGASYTVSVTAHSAAGDSSPRSDTVTLPPEAGPPDPPPLPSVTAGDGQLTVSWLEPAGNGAAVTAYVLQWRRGASDWWDNKQPLSGTNHTIVGLRNGSQYEVQVRARNSVGWGDWSASAYGTPVGPPGAPRSLSLTPGVGEIRVSWRASQSNGSPVTGYKVYWEGGNRLSGTAYPQSASTRSYTITGLKDVTRYEVQVVAQSSVGSSLPATAYATTGPSTQQSSERVTIARGDVSTRGNCASKCYDLDYRIDGSLGNGPYTLECWQNGRRVWRGQWSGRVSTGCYFSGGTVYVIIDGIKSNTLKF